MEKKELEKYYKEIKKNLPCSFFMKITFMSEFKKMFMILLAKEVFLL